MPTAVDFQERAHALHRRLATVWQVPGALVELLGASDSLWSEEKLARPRPFGNPMNADLGMGNRPAIELRITFDLVVPWNLLEWRKLDSRQDLVQINLGRNLA
jgi:hypothetical protein